MPRNATGSVIVRGNDVDVRIPSNLKPTGVWLGSDTDERKPPEGRQQTNDAAKHEICQSSRSRNGAIYSRVS